MLKETLRGLKIGIELMIAEKNAEVRQIYIE